MEQIMNNIHMNQLCKVCGEPAAGFHFGAFTCEGCKSFFGRTYNNVSGVSECKNGGRCEITKKNRTSCKSCRLRKCLSVGMSKSGSRYGRRSNWFKIHCLLSAQSQNGLSSSPETNNNNSIVTNNNNTSPSNNHHSKNLPSTITSIGGRSGHGHGHGHGHSGSEPDRDRERHHHHHSSRDRTSSSSNPPHHRGSHNNNSGPLPFANLAALSPDSKEQFLTSLNRKMMNPDLCDYFRSAANANSPSFPLTNGLGGKAFYQDDSAEDMSRNTRSPGSLESPNSEASAEDTKSRHTPLFTLPPGSPLDVKPNDVLSFDLLTRDLLKLGYDPLRLWPAMLTTPPSLHQFNPYRFMFPNFPNAAAAAAAAGGFPGMGPGVVLPNGSGTPGVPSPLLPNGNLLASSKLLSAAACASASAENLTNSTSHNRRFPTSFVPAASSLTLTPPISHHGSEEPPSIPSVNSKFRNLPVQEKPIDLSAKGGSSSNSSDIVKVKREVLDTSSPNLSDDEDNSSEHSFSEPEVKDERKSELGDSDQENEELEEDGDDDESIRQHGRRRRSSSTSSQVSKRVRVSTPLDLTRTSNSTSSNPPTKIAT